MRRKTNTPKKGKPKTPQKAPKKTPQKAPRKAPRAHYVTHNIKSTCSMKMWKAMKYYQSSTHLLIAKLPFSRLVREIFALFQQDFRIRYDAMEALQTCAEYYLTDLFVDANRCAGHAKRVTIMPTDIKLVLDLRGSKDPGFV